MKVVAMFRGKDYILKIQLTWACYLMCSIPISIAAKLELSLPIIQQRLNRESKSAGRLGRKYISWTKHCWDSAGRTTTMPSCGSSGIDGHIKFNYKDVQQRLNKADWFLFMLNSNISITGKSFIKHIMIA